LQPSIVNASAKQVSRSFYNRESQVKETRGSQEREE